MRSVSNALRPRNFTNAPGCWSCFKNYCTTISTYESCSYSRWYSGEQTFAFFFFWNFICTFYKLFLDFSFFLFLYNIGCQKLTENFFNCQIHKQLSFFCCFFCCISSTFLHSITCISDNRKAHAYLHQKIYVFCYIYLNSYTDMCILMSKWIDRHPLKFSKVLSYKVFERKNCFKRCIRNWLLQVGS